MDDCVRLSDVIDIIETCNSDGLKGIFCSYDDGERFKDIIKTLPIVQPETCDDAISRVRVIEWLENVTDDSIEHAIDSNLEFIPSIQPEQKTGITIPDNATNGSAICYLYPDLKYSIHNGRVMTTIGVAASFDLEWWNAPYKREEE